MLPPCPAEPMPNGSRTAVLLAKPGPIRNGSNDSVITYLRRKIQSYCADVIAARREWGENM